jgi:hypothetical protein
MHVVGTSLMILLGTPVPPHQPTYCHITYRHVCYRTSYRVAHKSSDTRGNMWIEQTQYFHLLTVWNVRSVALSFPITLARNVSQSFILSSVTLKASSTKSSSSSNLVSCLAYTVSVTPQPEAEIHSGQITWPWRHFSRLVSSNLTLSVSVLSKTPTYCRIASAWRAAQCPVTYEPFCIIKWVAQGLIYCSKSEEGLKK